MKKIYTLVATSFLLIAAVAFASPDKEAVIAAEKGAWQSIKDKKFDQFQKMLASDFRGVYASGIHTPDQEVTQVRTLEMKSYTLGEMNVALIGKEGAMVTYQVEVQGTEAGRDISGKMNAASIWKKDGNDWRIVFHTDIQVEEAHH